MNEANTSKPKCNVIDRLLNTAALSAAAASSYLALVVLGFGH